MLRPAGRAEPGARTDGERLHAVIESRNHFAALVAVLVVAGIAAVLVGRGSGNGRVEASTMAAQQALPRDNAAPPANVTLPRKQVPVKQPVKQPVRVPTGEFGLLPAPRATPVQLAGEGGALAPVVSRLPITDKVIFLGIDDGLVRDPRVLALLKHAKVPFTMFLVQSAADAGEAYWQQAQASGGTVEAHTITHPDLTRVSEAKRRQEICGTLDDFQSRFGRRPTLFRPPYGAYNPAVQADAASCGFKALIMWKGSTNDGRFDLQEGPNLHPGDIILLHWRTDLFQDLLKVFETVKAQGYSIGRLEDYLPDPPAPPATTTPKAHARPSG